MNARLVDVTGLHVLDQSVQLLIQLAVVDRERVAEPRAQPRPERQQQDVIAELLVALGVNDALSRVEPLEPVTLELHGDVTGDLIERVVPGCGSGERFAHPQRPVNEFCLGRRSVVVYTVAGELTQCERCLESCDTAARDRGPSAVLRVQFP